MFMLQRYGFFLIHLTIFPQKTDRNIKKHHFPVFPSVTFAANSHRVLLTKPNTRYVEKRRTGEGSILFFTFPKVVIHNSLKSSTFATIKNRANLLSGMKRNASAILKLIADDR
jgi:hypothetical protein